MRTIRNAERGETLELHIAECIAGALGESLSKLAMERSITARLNRHENESRVLKRLTQRLLKFPMGNL